MLCIQGWRLCSKHVPGRVVATPADTVSGSIQIPHQQRQQETSDRFLKQEMLYSRIQGITRTPKCPMSNVYHKPRNSTGLQMRFTFRNLRQELSIQQSITKTFISHFIVVDSTRY